MLIAKRKPVILVIHHEGFADGFHRRAQHGLTFAQLTFDLRAQKKRAVNHGQQNQDHGADDQGHADHGLTLKVIGGQHFLGSLADDKTEAVFRQPVKPVIPADAIYLRNACIGARKRSIATHKRRTHNLLPQRIARIREARHDFAVGHGHQRASADAKIQLLVIAGECVRAHGDHHHPDKMILVQNRPGELNRPFTRDFALERFADEQTVRAGRTRSITMDAKVFALAEEGAFAGRGQIGIRQIALGINNRHLKSDVADVFLAPLHQFGKLLRVAVPIDTHIQQYFVHALDGGLGILGKRLCLKYVRLFRQTQITGVTALQLKIHRRPDQNKAQDQRSGGLGQDAAGSGRCRQLRLTKLNIKSAISSYKRDKSRAK